MKKRYFSYLLRVWLAKDGESPIWRASMEDPHTGEQVIFASLERLFAFLNDQCTVEEAAQDPDSKKPPVSA